MASSINSPDERKILPQLVRFKDFAVSKENRTLILPIDPKKVTPLIEFKDYNIESLLIEWKNKKSEDLANEIVSAALVDDKKDEIQDVLDFLRNNNSTDLILNKIVNKDFQKFDLQKNIDLNHKRLKIEPNDSITWIDQAINFLELGERDDLLNCIENAVKINQDSSFILRNASRLFNILGDNGRAIKTLKNSIYYKYDPSILSAEIAFSQLERRRTKGTEYGAKILKDQKYNPYQNTELASALGTQEIINGDFKKSEALFDISLIDPNLNSFTQSFWYKKQPISVSEINKFSNSNEVQAHRFFKSQDFKKALEYSRNWIDDELFSTRPYNLAAYINGNLLENYSESLEIIQNLRSRQEIIKGNINEERDLNLRNDLAYYMLKSNKIEEAEQQLEPIKKNLLSGLFNKVQYIQLATLGLLAYRKGDREAGKFMYRKTITEFKKAKEPHYVQSAFINFFLEEINFVDNLDDLSKLLNELNDLIPTNSEGDILYRKNNAIQKLNLRIEKLKKPV